MTSSGKVILHPYPIMTPVSLNRRSWLGLAAGLLGLSKSGPAATPAISDRFQFVFMTDLHTMPQLRAGEGVDSCISMINGLNPAADFVITGGDLIMDALNADSARIQEQWALFDQCIARLQLPVHHTIGNHDIGGWSSRPKITPDSPEYGKRLFAERYGQGRTYRSFDHKNWHFILLDSIGLNDATGEYYGWVDDVQLQWLREDLAVVGKKTPVVVVTHIPFFSIWNQVHADPRGGENPKSLVNNAHVIRKILGDFNVKAVLCGHGHLSERIDLAHFNRTSYIQGGAVCGLWWKGKVSGNPEGFGVMTCHENGTFDYEYRSYGWA